MQNDQIGGALSRFARTLRQAVRGITVQDDDVLIGFTYFDDMIQVAEVVEYVSDRGLMVKYLTGDYQGMNAVLLDQNLYDLKLVNRSQIGGSWPEVMVIARMTEQTLKRLSGLCP